MRTGVNQDKDRKTEFWEFDSDKLDDRRFEHPQPRYLLEYTASSLDARCPMMVSARLRLRLVLVSTRETEMVVGSKHE